jgi:hypothetical protein
MWPYWGLFLLFAWPAITGKASLKAIRQPVGGRLWVGVFFILTLMIGLRHEVGGDWINYIEHYISIDSTEAIVINQKDEPLYWLIMWLAVYLDLGVYFANLVYASIFSAGLVLFCKNQHRPWLALTISVPYLIIVIGMGYTRQSVAIGLFMLALLSLQRHQVIRFIGFVVLASLFHRTAALLLPLAIFVPTKNRFLSVSFIIASAYYIYQVVVAPQLGVYIENYIIAKYQSDGALVRILMNLLPAIGFLICRKTLGLTHTDRKLWTTIALLAVASTVWLALSPSSTAVDRMALYLIPIQIYFFCRLPEIVGSEGSRRGWIFFLVLIYATVQFVWLFYSNYSLTHWVPYKFYPLEWLFV